jgi:ubiquinone biosynthesis UbiH/UbiF/VisC/COQ6 family hydroxylase
MSHAPDIVIVGGGIVGATLAALLARHAKLRPEQLLLVEPWQPAAPVADEPFDLRVSAVSRASRRILEAADAWHRLDAGRLAPYERMHVWHGDAPARGPDALTFDAASLGEADLGCIAENRALQVALLAACREAGVPVRAERLDALQFGADGRAVLTLGGTQLDAALVVGADGASSRVREAAGITAQRRSYGQHAIVATVVPERSHEDTAWQVFLDTGPLALLPLPGGRLSIVWSALDEESERLLALDTLDFDAALTRASDGVLGRLALAGERARFPLARLSAGRYVAPGCVLVGDAAHVIHPLAGQGVNQGLLDAACLCDAIAARPAREAPWAPSLLRRYERQRRSGNALMGQVVDSLDGLFTGSRGAVRSFAEGGMGLVNRSGFAKRLLARAAMGIDGDLPRLAGGRVS